MVKRKRCITVVFSIVGLCLLWAIVYAKAEKGLSAKEASRLIARMVGLELKTNAVRVKEVSTTGSSAVAIAEVEVAFRFAKSDDGKWRVAELRTGDRQWEDVDLLVRALNAEKSARARAELESLATALEAFRRERGFYVITDQETVLLDHLSPRYIARIIRIDPWHRPYKYEGGHHRFVLRSTGADGIADTADDVTIRNDER